MALRVLRFVGKGGVHGVGTVVFAVSAYVGRPGTKNMGLGSQLYKLCGRQSPIHYQKLNSIGTRASCSQSRRLASQNADPITLPFRSGKRQRAFMAAGRPNLRFQELRDEVMTERRPHRGRSRPGQRSSAQLIRWHIGRKRSNKLIESGSLALSLGYAFKG